MSKLTHLSHIAFALLALAANSISHASAPHNLVLLVPEMLVVSDATRTEAPALARLASDGARYVNTYSNFPGQESGVGPAVLDPLLHAAMQRRAAALVTATKDSPPDALIRDHLTSLKKQAKPFFLIYRIPLTPDSTDATDVAGSIEHSYAHDAPSPPLRMTVSAGAREADRVLATLEASLRELGLFDSTNIVVASAAGSSLVLKHSESSKSAGIGYTDVTPGDLPPGFVALDLLHALQRKDPQLRLFDPDNHHRVVFHTVGQHSVRGNSVIGVDLSHPLVHVETRGGHDRIFFPENVSAEDVRVYGALILSALS